MVTMTDLSATIAADLARSTSSRQALGGGGDAFGWAAEMPPTLASYATTATASGTSVPVTLVTESGTPVAVVGEGAAKPLAVQITPGTLPLVKHAGYAEVTLEAQLDAAGIYPAVVSVLSAGAMKSYEISNMAVLAAEAGSTVQGATWLEALYAGQGAVLAAGGRPSLIVASAADYGVMMAEISNAAGYALDPASPTGVLAGSLLHFSSGLATGSAFVADKAAILCAQHEASPILSVDTSGINNKTRVVADLVAGTVVTSPAHVVGCSLSA